VDTPTKLAFPPPHSANSHNADGSAAGVGHLRDTMSNMPRNLRIAYSAVCGIVCLLLIALWVRSYRYRDGFSVELNSSKAFEVFSLNRELSFSSLTGSHASFQEWGYQRFEGDSLDSASFVL
jgi:hypothetical protein